ncbi:MAG: hypothetical protein EA401_14245 [Planctomycetota bacterium]|nr:MAG: hypothetical protein EA401_14245 [Planctomycetota bacterium]
MRLMWRTLIIAALMVVAAAAFAQSYDEQLANTDRSDPDALYRLVVWCQENQFHARANQHIREIYAIDPNHAPTRELQGFVWDGRRWVHSSRMPGGGQQDDDRQREQQARATGPGPKAEDIDWQLRPLTNPDEDGGLTNFLTGVINSMNRGNRNEWATLMLEGQREVGLPLLMQRIADGDYSDLYGPVKILEQLIEEGNIARARRFLPFVMKVSSGSNHRAEDLALFSFIVSKIGDKRVVPRLIQLLDHADDDVQFNSRFALGRFMHRGVDAINAEEAQEWWDRFHSAPDSVIYAESLSHRDPRVRLSAVESITVNDFHEKVVPVLAELLTENDRAVFMGATQQLQRVTGSTWDVRMNASQDERETASQRLLAWWEEEKNTFTPMHMRGQVREEQEDDDDPTTRMAVFVAQLGDLDEAVSRNALSQLRRAGDDAIAPLINGLQHNDGVVRNRARDLLREITGQNFSFQGMRGSEEERQQAREAWIDWARANGHMDSGN